LCEIDIHFVIMLQARWSQLYPAAVHHINLYEYVL